MVFTIHGSRFTYGTFLTEVLSFAISAAVVYFVIVIPVSRGLEAVRPQPGRDRAELPRMHHEHSGRGAPLPGVHRVHRARDRAASTRRAVQLARLSASRARAVAARTVRKGSPAVQPAFRSGF
jgi:hypothetical protein